MSASDAQRCNEMTLEHQSRMNALVEAEEFNLVAVLRPRIYIDGDMWCCLYGENVQDGVAGFGGTPYKSVLDFNRSWHTPISVVAEVQK